MKIVNEIGYIAVKTCWSECSSILLLGGCVICHKVQLEEVKNLDLNFSGVATS